MDMDIPAGYGDSECSSAFFGSPGPSVDPEFRYGYAVCHTCHGVEKPWICHDLLSVGAGESAGRTL